MAPYQKESIYKLEYSNMKKIFNPDQKFLLNINLDEIFKEDSYFNSNQTPPNRIKRLVGNLTNPIFIIRTGNKQSGITYEISEKNENKFINLNSYDGLNYKELLILNKLKLESIKESENHSLVRWRKENCNEETKDMALYVISLSWTFGRTNYFLKYLVNSIKKRIIDNYFNQLCNLKVESFVLILETLRILRNKISHNNVIYNIDYFQLLIEGYKKSKNKLLILNSDISSKLKIEIKNKEIRLFQIIEILNKIIPEDNISNIFQFKLLNLKDKIDSESFSYIKSKLGVQ